MFGSQVPDISVGLVFVYLLLSIICTAANEMIAALLSLRARTLAKGITNLFADRRIKGLDELFYDHPLIKSLYRGTRKPSYIPARTFALAFLDGIAPVKGDGDSVMGEIKAAVDGLPSDSELKRQLKIFLQQAGDDFAKFQAGIETWFNDAMARVSGWYKREAQVITLILALVLAGITNADTFQIVKSLSIDSALRASVVTQAQEFAKHQSGLTAPKPEDKTEPTARSATGEGGGSAPAAKQPVTMDSAKGTMTQALENLQQLGIPLGWQVAAKKGEWVNKIIGLLLTTLAISLGAPFWFDLLNKISKIRSAGAIPEPPGKEEKTGKPV